jgi:hypothetical protein
LTANLIQNLIWKARLDRFGDEVAYSHWQLTLFVEFVVEFELGAFHCYVPQGKSNPFRNPSGSLLRFTDHQGLVPVPTSQETLIVESGTGLILVNEVLPLFYESKASSTLFRQFIPPII